MYRDLEAMTVAGRGPKLHLARESFEFMANTTVQFCCFDMKKSEDYKNYSFTLK